MWLVLNGIIQSIPQQLECGQVTTPASQAWNYSIWSAGCPNMPPGPYRLNDTTTTEVGGALSCPPNSTAMPNGRCRCDDRYTAQGPRCVPRVDIDISAKPQVCAPHTPKPIYPLSGTERMSMPLGFNLGGRALVLTYNTARRAPTDTPDLDPVGVEGGALGELWFSSLHRRLTVLPFGKGVSVSRGDGDVVHFLGSGLAADADVADRLTVAGSLYQYRDARAESIETYGNSGQLLRIEYGDGRAVAMIYSDSSTPLSVAPAPGYLIQATDQAGREVRFEYELTPGGTPPTDGRIRRMTVQGFSMTFGYSGSNLSAINWPDATATTFAYERIDVPWALTRIIDERNAVHATVNYDSAGRAISSAMAGGVGNYAIASTAAPTVVVNDAYDAINDIVVRTRTWSVPSGLTVTQPNGSTSSYGATALLGANRLSSQSQPAGSGCAASSSAIGYDANGNVASRDDFNGHRTCYANDLARNLESVRVEGLAAGAACTVTASGTALPAGTRKTSTQWHPDWSLRTRVAEPGRITTSVYNGQPDPFTGATASCAPAGATLPDGKPIAVLCQLIEQATNDADGSAGFSAALQGGVPARERRWTYDAFGHVLTETDPLGRSTFYSYYTEPNDAGGTVDDLRMLKNPAGHKTQFTSYDKLGNWLQMVDPNGIITTRSFDARQRLTSTTTAGLTTSYEYWPTGLLKKLTQPDGSFVSYAYDDAHRLTSVTDNLGNSVAYTLDAMGNRTAEQAKDPSGVLRRQMARSIDALGRVQQLTGRE